jgi:hypothetical protein
VGSEKFDATARRAGEDLCALGQTVGHLCTLHPREREARRERWYDAGLRRAGRVILSTNRAARLEVHPEDLCHFP